MQTNWREPWITFDFCFWNFHWRWRCSDVGRGANKKIKFNLSCVMAPGSICYCSTSCPLALIPREQQPIVIPTQLIIHSFGSIVLAHLGRRANFSRLISIATQYWSNMMNRIAETNLIITQMLCYGDCRMFIFLFSAIFARSLLWSVFG